MPQYKLSYFNLMGRAEPMRLMFAYAGVAYEDHRIEGQQWAELKPKTPNGQLPVLQIDGKEELSQSMAISHYLSKKFGLDGKDDWESAKVREAIETMADVKQKLRVTEQDPEKKAAIVKALEHDTVEPYLARLAATLKKNGSGFLVGSKPTEIDFHLFHAFNYWQQSKQYTEALNKHSEIQTFLKKFENLPGIKSWLEKRPKTSM
uniref:glutathione transferase n=1 Tax=Plectus sambesii TaxID=2011161 RepID=A0A914VUJ9_9BILA